MAHLILFTNNFPYGDGETFLETEIFFLSNNFDNIHIFPLFYGNNKVARSLPDNINFSVPFFNFNLPKARLKLLISGIFNNGPLYFSINEFFSKRVYLNFHHIKNWLSESCITRNILSLKNKKTILSKTKNDTIFYFYWGDKSSGIIPHLKKLIKNPIICRFHNSDLYEEIKHGYIPYRTSLLKSLTTAIFISQKGETYMKERYPEINFCSTIFKLGVNRTSLSKSSKDNILRIVSCSYVVPIKRIDLIIDTLNLLNINIEWSHIGGGPLLNLIKNKSKILRSNITVKFLGHLKNQDVLDYYKNNPVDLFLNVSASEGIPVSIMEAISAGIPVIATDVGGTSEIINHRFGRLINKNFSIENLSHLIENFYRKEDIKKEAMRHSAVLFWAQEYSSEKNYTNFSKYLLSLLTKKPHKK